MNESNCFFDGPYGELCLQFIQYKRSIGYKYGARSVRAMKELNQYLTGHEDSYGGIGLTKAVVLDYSSKREGEEPMTRQMRESFIRQFAIYLNSLGMPSYVAPIRKKEKGTFTPYIFTRSQICDILKAADSMAYEYRSPNHHYVYPFLLRLLYCCGLRISEALTLDIRDIDFDENVLKIKQAKYNNSRLVPISDSLSGALEKYMQQVGYSRDSHGLLFRNRWGEAYRTNSILCRFKKLLAEAGIPCTENGRLPRIHDIRHTFAVHSLEQMAGQGMDTYLAIPYLAEYMGHRKIQCTEQYLRFTADAYGDVVDALTPYYENLFPKGGGADGRA